MLDKVTTKHEDKNKMSGLVVKKSSTEIIDIDALGRYAKEQLDLGDQAAEEAGIPYRFRAVEALDKAKSSVLSSGKETFEEYQVRVTGRNIVNIRLWRRARNNQLKLLEDSKGRARSTKIPQTIRGLAGISVAGQSHMRREWTPTVDAQAKLAFREQVSRTIETARQEAEAEKALARRLIDIGYKVLAKELHPDAGGNREAMTRLSEVKRRLYRAFNL